MALESLAHTTILRLSNMIARGGGKFLDFLLTSMHSRSVIGLREDERRSFVARDDVARLIVALTSTQATGLGQVLNVGGPDGLSRLQLAELVASSANVTIQIHGCEADARAAAASVPDSNSNKVWCVYRIPAGSVAVGAVLSPVDVTMNSEGTLEAFGDSVLLRSMREALAELVVEQCD